jgi:hypothetical protein
VYRFAEGHIGISVNLYRLAGVLGFLALAIALALGIVQTGWHR